jgi:hypothetical protein
MKYPSKAIVCGLCHVAVASPTDPKPDDEISCLNCGARDRFEYAYKVIYQHIEYRLKRAAGKSVSRTMGEINLSLIDTTMTDTNEPFFKWRIKD